MNYKISIIIPIFNVEFYIERCLLSLFNQSIGFDNLEIILADDCSTDRTREIIKIYSDNYDNIKHVFLDENSGSAGKPRNVGLDIATSEYVMFLDPDDFFTPNACEILYNKITSENVDIVSGRHSRKDSKGEYSVYPSLWIDTLTNPNDSYNDAKKKTNEILKKNHNEIRINSIDEMPSVIRNFGLSSKIFRMSFIKQHNISFPIRIPAQDTVFIFNSFLNASGIIFIEDIIYCYDNNRNDVNNQSLTHQVDVNRNIDRLKSYNIMLEISEDKNKIEYYAHYLLGGKLIYFLNNFVINTELSIEDIKRILQEAHRLFKVVYESEFEIPDRLKSIFENVAKKRIDAATNIIINLKTPKITNDSWKEIKNINDIKVAVIMDPFTYNSYSGEFKPVIIEPETWLETFEKEKPDLFFCESAFHGIRKENLVDGIAIELTDANNPPWDWKIRKNMKRNEEKRTELLEILKYCNQNNIPTIFWNKEDPTLFNSSFSNFIDTALRFDYIFTTAEECIPKYIEKGHSNVNSLFFATQIKLFNPIEQNDRTNDIIFAGSWYNQFTERCKTMSLIFDRILDKGYNLKIYDRLKKENNVTDRVFPKKYEKFTHNAVPFYEMPSVYKESKLSLTINTVTDSYSMFARRIFELMSSNTFVISNFSKGIFDLFGDNVLYLDKNDEINIENLDKICDENLYNVLENHTYYNRFKYILNTIGFPYKENYKNVTIFYKLNSLSDLESMTFHFESIDYYHKKIGLVLSEEISLSDFDILNEYLDEYNYIYGFEDELLNFNKDEIGDYFIFADLDLSKDLIYKGLLHFQYLNKYVGIMFDDEKYMLKKYSQINNILFDYENYENIINLLINQENKEEIDIYTI